MYTIYWIFILSQELAFDLLSCASYRLENFRFHLALELEPTSLPAFYVYVSKAKEPHPV